MTDLPRSSNHTCICVAVDRFSKACKLIPLPGLPTAFEAAEALFNHVFRNLGIPKTLCRTEVHNSSLECGKRSSGSSGLRSACLLDNTLIVTARLTGRSRRLDGTRGPIATSTRTAGASSSPGLNTPRIPFGRPPLGSPPFSVSWVFSRHSTLGLLSPLSFQLLITGSIKVRGYGTRLKCMSSRQCGGRRTKQIVPFGTSLVPAWTEGEPFDLGHSPPPALRKRSPRYIGPFTVQRQLNELTYRLNLPPQYQISPSFHVSRLKPFTEPVTSPPTEPVPADIPPPPVPIKEEPIYQVRIFLDSWRRGPRLEYLVDWEDYRADLSERIVHILAPRKYSTN
ncbi:uncharacterized protein LOC120478755 isoform X1 [Pimephales promelas]|uniref:uncharacterized protein LOC120478755 isoform X1 n=1 Tax=Pimephales promelas TaxID=90988 RepID=UPI001955745A|nr:uncharacterized protein LOC120478755 isoform X1 [Pimephales promelas]